MKKNLLAFSACMTLFLISCSSGNKGGMSDTAKKNLATAQAIDKMFETQDYSKIGDYIAKDAVDHAGDSKGQPVRGLDSIKANFASTGAMMKDFKSEVVKELADDDYVFQWMKETYTMKIDAMGMKAGSTNTTNAIEASKFKDGKVTEHWSFIDWNDMMKMMPQPAPGGTDATGNK
jgi:predicted SnoaL-like aldol condensation-catalyzing enzyme